MDKCNRNVFDSDPISEYQDRSLQFVNKVIGVLFIVCAFGALYRLCVW